MWGNLLMGRQNHKLFTNKREQQGQLLEIYFFYSGWPTQYWKESLLVRNKIYLSYSGKVYMNF
jgi:hypothetical protein